jgi:hypothetical protein
MTETAKNTNLQKAREAKKDEFYTQLPDIENELRRYKEHFASKVVLCNCDDPRVSWFFHYFSHTFHQLGLKKLITTCYKSQDPESFSRNDSEKAVYLEYAGHMQDGRVPKPEDIGIRHLQGDGDFRSPECIELLAQADIVVTNPPFSLFREYVAQLLEHDKRFIIIGHQNAVTYKDIFRLIRDNKMWLGYGFNRNCAHFINPSYADYASDADHREGMIRVSGVHWFTNLDIAKRHENLILHRKYHGHEQDYPRYDNYEAINVDAVKDIPKDYEGIMGVPTTFLHKFNPEQFEIVGNEYDLNISKGRGYVNGKRMYSRLFIRNRKPKAQSQ